MQACAGVCVQSDGVAVRVADNLADCAHHRRGGGRDPTHAARGHAVQASCVPAWQCKGVGTVRVFRQNFTLEDAIEFHAFAPLEALPCV
jgi:hypothetical protein